MNKAVKDTTVMAALRACVGVMLSLPFIGKRVTMNLSNVTTTNNHTETPEDVIEKLKILQLGSKDGHGYVQRPRDPLLDVYERGLKALHREKWREAAKSFER